MIYMYLYAGMSRVRIDIDRRRATSCFHHQNTHPWHDFTADQVLFIDIEVPAQNHEADDIYN